MSFDAAGEPSVAPAEDRVAVVLRRLWRTLGHLPLLDGAINRTVGMLQLTLSAAVLLSALFIVIGPFAGDAHVFAIGAVTILVVAGAALFIPWARFSPWWSILVPLIDVVAIGIMRLSGQTVSFNLFMFLPLMWLCVYFGLAGYLLSVVVIPLTVLWTTSAAGVNVLNVSTMSLAITLVVIATACALLARRIAAQRGLFERQSQTMVRTMRRAQRQEEILAEVLDTVDFGIIRIAPDGSTTVTNEAHGRLQRAVRTVDAGGAAAGAAFASDGTTQLDPDELPFARAARGEVFDNQIVWFGAPGSRRRALSISARRTRGVDGADGGAVVISRDVTAELTALRARDSLVASVSHELRTPLTSIIGYLELAVDDTSIPPRPRENLEIAERNAARLLEIVSDILTASSRSEMSADLTISQQDMDIAGIVRASGEAWVPTAAERAIEIDLEGVQPAPAYADPLRIRQVIDNLVSNAVKYNRDGGRVELSTQSDGLTTSVVVRDTGIGISPEDQSRLFARYFRADGRASGTGLGLSISRDLVRAHGGDISVHSAPGTGTTLTVILPSSADAMDAAYGDAPLDMRGGGTE